MIASTGGSIIVPLAADFTTANIPDNQVYSILTASLPVTIIKRTLYMSADPGYDDHELYDFSTYMGFRLVCPVQRYKNTSEERIKLIEFYESNIEQAIYLFIEKYIYRTVDRVYQIYVQDRSITCTRICQDLCNSTIISFAISDTHILQL